MKFVIGIDLGGTKVEGALLDNKLNVIRRYKQNTEAEKGRKAVLGNILEVINALKTKDVSCIGLAHPGFEQENKKLTSINNIPSLMNFDLRNFLKRETKTKIMMKHDVSCSAIAEHRLGAAKGAKNSVCVMIGTGIGGGVVINNQLYNGGGACEIGYMVIDTSGIKSSQGVAGNFESWCSGKSIVKYYKKLGGKMTNPEPKKIFSSDEKAAKLTVRQEYEKLGIALGNIINIIGPEVIVLGGGVSKSLSLEKVKKETRKTAYPALAKGVKIVKAKLDSPGVIGAAMLALERTK